MKKEPSLVRRCKDQVFPSELHVLHLLCSAVLYALPIACIFYFFISTSFTIFYLSPHCENIFQATQFSEESYYEIKGY